MTGPAVQSIFFRSSSTVVVVGNMISATLLCNVRELEKCERFPEESGMEGLDKYSFGRKLLESQGWKSGKGLGRDESGISEAIKPTLKFDKAGVGHNQGDDFSFHWWDHVYKKAADNIVVEHSEDGVAMKQIEAQADLISTKKWKHMKKKNKSETSERAPLTYGVFMKSSTLAEAGEVRDGAAAAVPSSDDEDEDHLFHHAEQDHVTFKACEGRTAHKGARHGLTASGKLKRLQAQEMGLPALVLTNGMTPRNTENGTIPRNAGSGECAERTLEVDSPPKLKKRKKNKLAPNDTQETDSLIQEVMNGTAPPSRTEDDLGVENAVGRDSPIGMKRKKKRRKRDRENGDIPARGRSSLNGSVEDSCSNRILKSGEGCLENVVNGIDVVDAAIEKHRKKKRKH